ncbi:putative ABC transporter permease subunit [Clostridium sp. 'White wine YQ']|uniref:putative ABC transporter permease subunit n=1 Tax=Clostridium sp. 'White wine YQ' TaxID=3027474 RepID=UPI002367072E|nr:hypothetical protein [Clostridium sp. 'White wine YQ']MDD7795115.1 hypothetical protein [Clostridium sp. 'White wine YQ']
MNKLWILTKFFLKNFLHGLTASLKGTGQKVVTVIAILILLVSIAVPITILVSAIYEPLVQLNQKELILGTLFNAASTVVFIFGITGIISIFYFSQDVEWLLPLPIKPSHIVIGKFLTLLFYEYIILACIVPAVLTYGVISGAGIIYYLYSIVVFLTLPIIPIAYGTILSFVLMRFTNLSKHKDAFKVIVGFFGIILGLGINVIMQRMGNGFKVDNPQDIQSIFGQGSIFDRMTTIFFNVKFSTYALTESSTGKGLINIGLLVLVIAIVMIVLYKLADTLYIKGVVGISESNSNKKNLSSKQKENLLKENSQLVTWMKREVKVLLRTPSYVINCISTLVLPIIVLVIPFLGGASNGMEEVIKLISSTGVSLIILAGYTGIMAFFVSTNAIASTAISREGQEIFVTKYLPTTKKTQLLAKVYVAILLSSITNLICALGLVIFKANILVVIGAFLGGEIVITLICILGVIIDTYAPKLEWESEQQAVKNNLNVLKTMGVTLLIIIVSIILYVAGSLTVSNLFGISIVAIALIIGIVISYKILVNKATLRLERIE